MRNASVDAPPSFESSDSRRQTVEIHIQVWALVVRQRMWAYKQSSPKTRATIKPRLATYITGKYVFLSRRKRHAAIPAAKSAGCAPDAGRGSATFPAAPP